MPEFIEGITSLYFFYVDESGTKDPKTIGTKKDGSACEKDRLYVLFAVSLHEFQWERFERTICDRKMRIIHRVSGSTGERFDLADAELHSSVIRIPEQRGKHNFFKHVTEAEMGFLIEAYYNSIKSHHMNCFAVIVDKKALPEHCDQEFLHKKTYELLLERIELFLADFHPKQKGLIIMDNSNKQLNRLLAMKHSYFLKNGSTSGQKFKHIVEMPMFVESTLSNGAQLADLCAYNCYHAIKYDKPNYPYFQITLPSFYNSPKTKPEKFDGIKIYPESTEIKTFINESMDLNKRAIELLPPDSP
ncbi:MAG: DUF3800 domain-containing protein [Nitrospiraceae bacterium]|nr:DUF3800 domain-containing protein [Nitrospiraceae bacterium]